MSRKRQAKIPNPNGGETQGGNIEAQMQGAQMQGIQWGIQKEDGPGPAGPQLDQEDHESQDASLFSSTL